MCGGTLPLISKAPRHEVSCWGEFVVPGFPLSGPFAAKPVVGDGRRKSSTPDGLSLGVLQKEFDSQVRSLAVERERLKSSGLFSSSYPAVTCRVGGLVLDRPTKNTAER